MAFATHLTLATGHTLLGEGDETPNKNEMQRVSVSITYELERGDLDVPLLATVKASELAQAHRAAAEVLRAHAFAPPAPVCAGLGKGSEEGLEDANPFHQEEPEGDEPEGTRADDEAPPDEAFYVPLDDEQAEGCQEAEDGQQWEDEEEPEEGQEPENGSQVPTYRQWIAGAGMRRHDQSPSPNQASSPGQEAPPGQTAGATVIPGPPPNGSPANGSYANGSLPSGTSPAGGETPTGPLLTPPKRLAIQSLASKIGLTPPEFSSLLRERFGVWSLHLLTKEQGEALHRALQDGLKEKQDREKQDREAAQPPTFAAPPVSSAHNGRNASASAKAVQSH